MVRPSSNMNRRFCLSSASFTRSVCMCLPAGQYGKVCGFIEPLPEDASARYEFANEMVGTSIPPEYYPACEKGFREAANAGALIGAPVEVRGGVCCGGGLLWGCCNALSGGFHAWQRWRCSLAHHVQRLLLAQMTVAAAFMATSACSKELLVSSCHHTAHKWAFTRPAAYITAGHLCPCSPVADLTACHCFC